MRTALTLRLVLLGLVLAPLLAGSAAASQVLVVDPANGPGTDFTSLGFATAFAGDGAILLLRPGAHDSALIDGKSLTLIGDPGPAGQLPVVRSLAIRNVPATKQVVVRNVVGDPNPGNGAIGLAASLDVFQCQGPVVIERFTSVQEPSVYSRPVAVRVRNCERVSLTRCTLRGAAAVPQLAGGGQDLATPALQIDHATVYLYQSSAEGGAGTDAISSLPFTDFDAYAGAAGVELVAGSLVAVGAAITGGAGGDGLAVGATCKPAADGGPGLVVAGATKRVDCVIAGGAAGIDAPGCPPTSAPGLDVVVISGAVVNVAEPARTFEVASPVRAGQPALNTVQGVPGEFAALLIAFAPQLVDAGVMHGGLLPGAPMFFVGLGNLPASGVFQFAPVIPPLPAGVDGVTFYEQVVVAGQSGLGFLSTPCAAVIVASGF